MVLFSVFINIRELCLPPRFCLWLCITLRLFIIMSRTNFDQDLMLLPKLRFNPIKSNELILHTVWPMIFFFWFLSFFQSPGVIANKIHSFQSKNDNKIKIMKTIDGSCKYVNFKGFLFHFGAKWNISWRGNHIVTHINNAWAILD